MRKVSITALAFMVALTACSSSGRADETWTSETTRQVESIEIPAKGEAVLKPGSLHIMLFDIHTLAQGTPFPLTLTLDDGQTLSLSLPVKPVEPMKGMKH